jgi:hypothetical protein
MAQSGRSRRRATTVESLATLKPISESHILMMVAKGITQDETGEVKYRLLATQK